jgi:Cu-Zn family superoxide dismutase
MKHLTSATVFALACVAAFCGRTEAQDPAVASARLIDADGREVGVVRLLEAPTRGVLLRIEVSGLTAGLHAIHIHETGRCEPPTFQSAGERMHHRGESVTPRAGGRSSERMSLRVPGEGRVEIERLAPRVTLASSALNSLFDDDGSAILIYAGDEGAPVGLAVACGVIER